MAKTKEQKLKETNYEKYLLVVNSVFEKEIAFDQKLYNFENNIKSLPLCIKCEKVFVTFKGYRQGYKLYCPVCGHSAPGVYEKRQATVEKKYGPGITNVFQATVIKASSEETCMEKYGVSNINKLPEFKERVKKETKERTGYESHFQNPVKKAEIVQIIIDKHGGFPMQTEIGKQKIKKTSDERYGGWYLASKENRELLRKKEIQLKGIITRRNTNILRFGFAFASQMPESKAKLKRTIWDRYGVTSIYDIPNVAEKTMETMLREYGVKFGCLLRTKPYRESKPEIELREKTGYNKFKIGTKEYDMKVPETNILIEVDGEYWHPKDWKGINFSQLNNTLNDYEKELLAASNEYQLYRIDVSSVKRLLKQDIVILEDIIKNSYEKQYTTNFLITEIITSDHLLYCIDKYNPKRLTNDIFNLLEFCELFLNQVFESPKLFLKEVYNIEL